jgi:hypothetical protein
MHRIQAKLRPNQAKLGVYGTNREFPWAGKDGRFPYGISHWRDMGTMGIPCQCLGYMH